jgi:arylsulfatase A-like enzyme
VGADDPERSVFCAIGMGWPMIRRGHHKYFVHPQQGSAVLFDLADDPGERVNLAGNPAYAQVGRDLSERLARQLAKPSLAQAHAGVAP